MSRYYTKDADGHGWLVVKYEDGSTYPPLPYYTLVEQTDFKDERVYFKILNGRSKDKIASLTYENALKYFADAKGQYGEPAKLYFNRTKGLLWYGTNNRNETPLSCRLHPEKLPPIGLFELEISDEIHPIGAQYYDSSKYATTWFRIGHRGDYYLHPGNISLGCVTVTDLGQWTNVYNYLITRRRGDYSVGTIEISNK
jgi:hypothetical protein